MADGRLIVVGAGGHAGVVVEVARSAGWDPQAAFDPDRQGALSGVPIVGDDGDIADYLKMTSISSAVVAIGDNRSRVRLANKIRSLGCATPAITHPSAHVSSSAKIAQGVVVMPGAVINANADIADYCIVNSGAIIEHDCVLEPGVHAAPGSVLGGTCRVGKSVLIGLGAVVRPGIAIGDGTIIGAGAVVVSDMPGGVTAVGVPASFHARSDPGPDRLDNARTRKPTLGAS